MYCEGSMLMAITEMGSVYILCCFEGNHYARVNLSQIQGGYLAGRGDDAFDTMTVR